MGHHGFNRSRDCGSSASCYSEMPAGVLCDAWGPRGETVAVDGQSRAAYDKMIGDRFQFTQDNLGAAHNKAAQLRLPVVAVFGSWEQNNSRSLIQNALPYADPRGEKAVYVHIDPTKCPPGALADFARAQTAGGHNAAMSIVYCVKPDHEGQPDPEPYTFRWQGAHPSMIPSFNQALDEAQHKMKTYKFAVEAPPAPPVPVKPMEKPAPPALPEKPAGPPAPPEKPAGPPAPPEKPMGPPAPTKKEAELQAKVDDMTKTIEELKSRLDKPVQISEPPVTGSDKGLGQPTGNPKKDDDKLKHFIAGAATGTGLAWLLKRLADRRRPGGPGEDGDSKPQDAPEKPSGKEVALVRADSEQTPDYSKLREALGLPDKATNAEIDAALKKALGLEPGAKNRQAFDKLLDGLVADTKRLLGMPENASDEDVLKRISEDKGASLGRALGLGSDATASQIYDKLLKEHLKNSSKGQRPELLKGPDGPKPPAGPEEPKLLKGPDGPKPPAGPEEPKLLKGPEGPKPAAGPGEPELVKGPEGPKPAAGPGEPELVKGPEGPKPSAGPEGDDILIPPPTSEPKTLDKPGELAPPRTVPLELKLQTLELLARKGAECGSYFRDVVLKDAADPAKVVRDMAKKLDTPECKAARDCLLADVASSSNDRALRETALNILGKNRTIHPSAIDSLKKVTDTNQENYDPELANGAHVLLDEAIADAKKTTASDPASKPDATFVEVDGKKINFAVQGQEGTKYTTEGGTTYEAIGMVRGKTGHPEIIVKTGEVWDNPRGKTAVPPDLEKAGLERATIPGLTGEYYRGELEKGRPKVYLLKDGFLYAQYGLSVLSTDPSSPRGKVLLGREKESPSASAGGEGEAQGTTPGARKTGRATERAQSVAAPSDKPAVITGPDGVAMVMSSEAFAALTPDQREKAKNVFKACEGGAEGFLKDLATSLEKTDDKQLSAKELENKRALLKAIESVPQEGKSRTQAIARIAAAVHGEHGLVSADVASRPTEGGIGQPGRSGGTVVKLGKAAEIGGHKGFWLGTVIVIGVGALIVTPVVEPREFNPTRK